MLRIRPGLPQRADDPDVLAGRDLLAFSPVAAPLATTLALAAALALAPGCEKRSKSEGSRPAEPAGSKPSAGDGPEAPQDEELVDLYGDPLPTGAIARLGSIRMMDRALGKVIFSPDGAEIVTSSEDAYLIWQTTTGQRVGSLVRENAAHPMAFSADGKILATAVYGGAVQLWDYPGRAAGAVLEGHRRDVTDLCFAGDRLVSGSRDRTVRRWKIAPEPAPSPKARRNRGPRVGETEATWRGDFEEITAVACSAKGAVAFADDQGAVLLVKPGADEATAIGNTGAAVLDVALSGDGERVAAGSVDGAVRIWTAGGGEPVIIKAHPREVLTVVFAGADELVTSGGDDSFRTWNPETGERIAERRGAAGIDAQLFALSPDGALIAGYTKLVDGRASEAGRFWLYDRDSGEPLLEPERHADAVTAVEFVGTEQVVTASADRTVKLWKADSSELVRTIATHRGPVRDISVIKDRVYSAGDDARMHVASLNGGDTVILEPIGGAVHAFVPVPGGGRIITGDFVGKVHSFSLGSGQRIARHDGDAFGQIHDIAVSPDGNTFAIAGANPEIHIIGAATGKKLTTLSAEGAGSHYAVAFSPDGKMLASGGDDHQVRLWGTKSWSQLRALEGHDGTVRSVAFSPDGRLLAAGSSDQSARLWSVATGEELTLLVGHRGAVTELAFSSDSKLLATSSADQTALIWQVSSPAPSP
jgi:WD40 repeat protein